MNIKIEPEILMGLKSALQNEEKSAVRFELVDFGWNGPLFGIVLDEQKEDDFVTEVESVKFVAETKFAKLIKNPEIIKADGEFIIKKAGCGC